MGVTPPKLVMSTRLIERWSYGNTVPRGRVYVDTDDLFLFVRTTSTTVRLNHPVYYVQALGSPDFYIDLNDGTCLELNVDENPEPDVDKVLFRIPKNKVRFELKGISTGASLSDQQLFTNALIYNGSYTASSTTVQGKWAFYTNTDFKFVDFRKYDSSIVRNCYIFDEFRPFVLYYNGLYMIFYDKVSVFHDKIIN